MVVKVFVELDVAKGLLRDASHKSLCVVLAIVVANAIVVVDPLDVVIVVVTTQVPNEAWQPQNVNFNVLDILCRLAFGFHVACGAHMYQDCVYIYTHIDLYKSI